MSGISDESAQVKVTIRGISLVGEGKVRVGVNFSLVQQDGWAESATLDVVLQDEGQTLTEIQAAAIARGRTVLSRIASHQNL
jgi:hypothetical protein